MNLLQHSVVRCQTQGHRTARHVLLSARYGHVEPVGVPCSTSIEAVKTMTSIRSIHRIIGSSGGLGLAATIARAAHAQVTVVYVSDLFAAADMAWSKLCAQVQAISRTPVDQLIFDLRGHGDSGSPPASTVTTLEDLASDLASVVESVHTPVVLVGHSMGTMVIQRFAGSHRVRFSGQVRGVVLVNPAASAPLCDPALHRILRVSAVLRPRRGRGPLNTFTRVGQVVLHRRRRTFPIAPGRRAARDVLRADLRVVADVLVAASQFETDRSSAAMLACTAVRLVAAQHDRITPPSDARLLAGLIPGARLHVVAGDSHDLPRTHPHVCARAICEVLSGLPEGPHAALSSSPQVERPTL
ncbi:alpha/beta fold hydrolase [Nocardia brasiliensis]|uniref:alpha/beta fold hydrolase n=1 Tax=Nocardia brasiliensis TaxID=37326 RepID=UPI00245903C9|nr:alpha/beta hydrolase [Nocardia brasiliensis]